MNQFQTVDLHDVEAYFKSRNLVDDRHRPYCLRWLQRFLSGPWGAGRLAPNDALAAFAQHLEQDGRTEEWQVRQAIRSVELFQKHYLRHLRETGAALPAAVAGQMDATGTPQTFGAALGEARTLIRLRHYAYRTEQTYLEWLSRYGRFADQRTLPCASSRRRARNSGGMGEPRIHTDGHGWMKVACLRATHRQAARAVATARNPPTGRGGRART